jgi:hypothetical protein
MKLRKGVERYRKTGLRRFDEFEGVIKTKQDGDGEEEQAIPLVNIWFNQLRKPLC